MSNACISIKGSKDAVNIEYEKVRQGSKNASLPVLCASLLFRTNSIIDNVPAISDIEALLSLIQFLGGEYSFRAHTVAIKGGVGDQRILPETFYDTRAGFYLAAALLNTWPEVEIAGCRSSGCQIGGRNHDAFLRVFQGFGCTITNHQGNLKIQKGQYTGNTIVLHDLGICATGIAIILAAQHSVPTVLMYPSHAPELRDLLTFLQLQGIAVKEDISALTIYRQENTREDAVYMMIQDDRIVIGTYAVLALMTNGTFSVNASCLVNLESVIDLLYRIHCAIRSQKELLLLRRSDIMHPTTAIIDDYPQLPTDLQPLITLLLCGVPGTSLLEDRIFSQRIHHVEQLRRLGQDIFVQGGRIHIRGGLPFVAGHVISNDLRCSAALLIAACIADGVTMIEGWTHVLRGYEYLLPIIQNNREVHYT